MKSFLKDNDIKIYSSHNERKIYSSHNVVAERFILNLNLQLQPILAKKFTIFINFKFSKKLRYSVIF